MVIEHMIMWKHIDGLLQSYQIPLPMFRTFTQVSIQWQDTDSMREELDDLQVFVITLCLHLTLIYLNKLINIMK